MGRVRAERRKFRLLKDGARRLLTDKLQSGEADNYLFNDFQLIRIHAHEHIKRMGIILAFN
jgi:hypothetical protein